MLAVYECAAHPTESASLPPSTPRAIATNTTLTQPRVFLYLSPHTLSLNPPGIEQVPGPGRLPRAGCQPRHQGRVRLPGRLPLPRLLLPRRHRSQRGKPSPPPPPPPTPRAIATNSLTPDPPPRPSQIFREISTYAQRVTGIDGIEIREKEIKLPQIPELPKPAAFEIKDYVDAGDAGKQNTLALMNRYFTTITQRALCPSIVSEHSHTLASLHVIHNVPLSPSLHPHPLLLSGSKAIVAEQIFFEGTDIVESTVVRTQDETLKIYQCCKITLTVNGKTVKKQVMAWWLDQKDRKICRDIDFLTTSVVRCPPQ